jgi:hypothetical protein
MSSMRKSGTAVSLQAAGSGNQDRNSKGHHRSRRCIGFLVEGENE